MRAPRWFWLGLLLAGATLSACAGGRGSSGFDISGENATIGHVIDTQQCAGHEGLTICPADKMEMPAVTATPALTATVTPSATPYTPTSATPTATMSMSPTATPTATPKPIPTQTPVPPPRVDTGLSDESSITCVQSAPGGPCRLSLTFSTQGFPSGASFRVAVRAIAPLGPWVLASPPQPSSAAADGTIETSVVLAGRQPPAHVQFAILVFVGPPPSLADEFDGLGVTGAEYAFVTPTLAVEVERDFPPPSATESPVVEGGPQITFFGVARADDSVLDPSGFDRDGRPIYERPTGAGMFLVIEAHPGDAGAPVGASGYDPAGGLPDLQLLVSRGLGDGSSTVCKGGVPATDPLRFTDSSTVVEAINDLGCHVNDGAGNPVGRNASTLACTRSDGPGSFGYGFVDPTTTTQYCVPIDTPWAFAPGDTIVAARVRDGQGNVGLTQQIVVRVGPVNPTPTRSVTPVMTFTAAPTSAGTPAATATVPPQDGPEITYMGITRSDYVVVAPTASDDEGRPILDRLDGGGLVLVVEARSDRDGLPVGASAFNAEGGAPDLQILVSRPLGDGSAAVCDKRRPDIGGVPGTDPPLFSDAPAVVDAMNDLGCRVSNGAGEPMGIPFSADACTIPNPTSEEFGFVDAQSTMQFCLPIAAAWSFQSGETIVSARVRDSGGGVGATREIILRIGAALTTPTPTATPPSTAPASSPTPTPIPTITGTPLAPSSGPEITYFGVARPDDAPMPAAGVDVHGRAIYVRPTGQGMFLVVEARPGLDAQPPGDQAFDPAGALPDLQLLVARRLGDGSEAICDDMEPDIGGVPATNPPVFSDAPDVVAAINDLGCRVNDGAGNPVARTASSQACTRTDAPGSFGYTFVDPTSTIQYCLPIAQPWGFPLGDTIVAARVRDTSGTVGAPQEIVVRVTGLP
jgi:hypothetical protein